MKIVSLLFVEKTLVSTVVSVFLWVTEFSASAQQDSLDDVAKLISMNVPHNLASMEECVLICPKVIGVNAHQVTQESIAKRSEVTAEMIHVQLEPCARMNQGTIISHVFAEVDILEWTAISPLILALLMETHVLTVLVAWPCNRDGISAIACQDGKGSIVRRTLTIVPRILACWEPSALI